MDRVMLMGDLLVTWTGYRIGTAVEAFARLQGGERPWVAIGDFLDDWYFRAKTNEVRAMMVRDEIAPARGADETRWAAFFAAMIHRLCSQYKVLAPAWVQDSKYVLVDPWFMSGGEALRAWELIESPPEFKMRNVFGGDNVLSRV